VSKLRLKYTKKPGGAVDEYWLEKRAFKKFSPSLLGFSDFSKHSASFEGLAVILDLKNFTEFCDQRDPQWEVPKFVELFLSWLFTRIADELFQAEDGGQVILSSHLPVFGKFLGDGVLLLWDVRKISFEARGNIVKAFDIICSDYQTEFLNEMKRRFTNPPSKLRCGIAQGQVTGIANEGDFVGLCINIAARLQKLGEGAFSFAFTKKGLEEDPNDWLEDFRVIRIPIRGVSKEELVYVLRREFMTLSDKDKKRFGSYDPVV
jgi:class 3 adenylate cyclase